MSEHNKGKKWIEKDENILIESLKNKKTLEECSRNIGRTLGSIKTRIEEIIYKKNIYEKQSSDELLYLINYVDISFDDIIEKYKNKYKNKTNKINKSDKDYKKDFEENVLNELEKIRLKQDEMSLDILKKKNEEINRLKLIIDELKEIKKKNENTITELLNTINKINIINV